MRYWIIAAAAVLSLNLYAQEYITVLDDSTGLPVESVSVISGSKGTTTNQDGKFALTTFSPTDTLTLSHVAYRNVTYPYEYFRTNDTIYLIPQSHSSGEVIVTDERTRRETSIAETVEITDEDKAVYTSTGDLLKKKTTLFIKDYGGTGSLQAVSARGLSSENTLVLFNEARINDLRTGNFDFSLINLNTVDNITYIKSSDEDNYYSAAGGIVKITTNRFEEKYSSLSLKASSDGMQGIELNTASNEHDIKYEFSVERSYSPNHYDYTFEEKDLERENAHFSKTFASANLGYIGDKFSVKYYSHYSLLQNGIPGFVVTNNYNSSRATHKNESFLNIANFDYLLNDGVNFNSTLSYHKQDLRLYDPEGNLLLQDDEQASSLNDAAWRIGSQVNNELYRLTLGYEFNYADIDEVGAFLSGINAPENLIRRVHRGIAAVAFTPNVLINFADNITVSASTIYERYEEEVDNTLDTDHTSYGIGLAFTPKLPHPVTIRTSYSHNYRVPTFNERYYSSIFNHDFLDKEEYKSFNAGIETNFEIAGEQKFEFTYYYIDGINKIIWVPTRLALQIPRSIGKVESTGIEAALYNSFLQNKLSLDLLYTYTSSKNKSATTADDATYDKQLVYTPEHRLNINTNLALGDFSISAYGSFVGKSYFTPDNNPLNELEHYFLIDASASYNFNYLGIKNRVTLSAYNITDKEYYVIQSYPMPLRSFQITYTMRIQ